MKTVIELLSLQSKSFWKGLPKAAFTSLLCYTFIFDPQVIISLRAKIMLRDKISLYSSPQNIKQTYVKYLNEAIYMLLWPFHWA